MAIIVLLSIILFATSAFAERFFLLNSTWYEKIPSNPVIRSTSSQNVEDILINSPTLVLNQGEWSVPVYYASENTPLVTVQLDNPSSPYCGSNSINNGWNIVPIPDGALPAGNDKRCSGQYRDGHMTIISHDRRYAWDFFGARKCGNDPWKATCVRKWDLSSDGINSPYDLKGTVRAASVPLLHGLLMYNEVLNDTINHALAFCYWGEKLEGHASLYPTETYRSGISSRPGAMLLGERIQLDPTLNCDTLPLTKGGKSICKALQEYGMIFVENCGQGTTAIYAEMGKNWNTLVGDLSAIPLNRLRVVEPIYPFSITETDTIPPVAPTDLRVSLISSTQISLFWTPSTDNVGVTGYRIYRCSGSNCAPSSQIATSLANSYTDSNLPLSTAYTYAVSAYDAAGNESAKSNSVTVTTPSNSSISNITVRAKGTYAGGAWPNMEVWVNGSKINSTIVNSSTYTDYFFSFNSGTINAVDIVFTNDYYNSSTGEDRNLWVDYIIINNNKYEAESVYAIIDKGYGSAAFDGLNVIPGQEGILWNGALRFRLSVYQPLDTLSPSAPSNLRATSVTSNTVTLSWTASTDNIGVAGYKIYRNGVQVSITASTYYKDTGLTPSTSYTYSVKAYDSSGNISQSSNSVLVKTTSNKLRRK